jgi:hypothetical protein
MQEEVQKKGARPTAWGRVGLAVAMVVLAVAGADAARQLLKKGSAGLLEMGGPVQAPLVDLQLATIGVIVAGAFAGATTGTGLRHGLIVGFVGALAVVGLASANVEPVLMVEEGVLWMFDLPTDGTAGGSGKLALGGSVFVMCVLAGWFGGQLLPVVVPPERRAKLALAS